MCTAFTYTAGHHLFGRTLDLDHANHEQFFLFPHHAPLLFRRAAPMRSHYAFLGIGTAIDHVPLLYDGINEEGLAIAGLHFPQNAVYGFRATATHQIAPFELIPWILARCRSVTDAEHLLQDMTFLDVPFSDQVPLAPLHWIISDRQRSITVESMADGLYVWDNEVGVLTNNPPLPYQMFHLKNYRHLRPDTGGNTLAPSVPLETYCEGLGGLGLPGDHSSMSRFVRTVFHKYHSEPLPQDPAGVNQCFHILHSVEMVRGACQTAQGTQDYTVYTGCMDLDALIYYVTTYDNCNVRSVNLHAEPLDADTLVRYPLL